ncbi:MAG TPA: hypothetical protein DCE78_03395 [Bacteroidetes bacterium]|nr:hypothetical protein [Bacteroidota bacterium]
MLIPISAFSQAYFSAGNVGMGDTGITHVTDSQASFINPANLMLYDGPGKWNINLLHGSHYYNKGYSSEFISTPRNYFTPFDSQPTSTGYLTVVDANQLLKKWFGSDEIRSHNEYLFDFQTIGISYKALNYALSFNHRLRGQSFVEIGRGWYDPKFKNVDDVYLLDRSLNHNQSIWHEVSFAVAWEQDLISGLLGSRSNIYLGINPKLILPVSFMQQKMDATYTWNESNPDLLNYKHSYVAYLTGEYAATIKKLPTTGNSANLNITPDYFDINGVGFGFDAGFTWRIIMGDKINLKSDNRIDSDYHLSFSVAVQDIGFVSYNKESSILSSKSQSQSDSSEFSTGPIDREYTGTMSDFVYFSNYNQPHFYDNLSGQDSRINKLLPSSITAGVGLKLDQVLFAVEYKQHSNNTLNQPEFRTLHVGNEITLFSIFDIRSGVIFHSNEPVTLSAGLGLDTAYFSLSAGTYARQIDSSNDFRPVLMNVGTVAVRF